MDGIELGDGTDVRACHTCAILCGLAILCGRVQSVAQWFGQHGCVGRHGILGCIFFFAGDHVPLIPGHVYFETSAMIITLIRIGKFLEARAKGRTSDAIKKLMSLRVKTAHVVRGA